MIKHQSINNQWFNLTQASTKKGIMLLTKAAIPNMGSAMPTPHYW